MELNNLKYIKREKDTLTPSIITNTYLFRTILGIICVVY